MNVSVKDVEQAIELVLLLPDLPDGTVNFAPTKSALYFTWKNMRFRLDYSCCMVEESVHGILHTSITTELMEAFFIYHLTKVVNA